MPTTSDRAAESGSIYSATIQAMDQMRHARWSWMRSQRTILAALLTALLWSASFAQDEQPWTTIHDQWFILEIDDAPVGWSHDVVAERGDHVRTVNSMKMRMRRGHDTVEVESTSTFIETRNGRPISYESLSKTGADTIRSLYSFEDDRVLISKFESDRRINSEMPIPTGEWLTPRAAEIYVRSRREAGALEISLRVLMPDQGLEPIGVETKYVGDGSYEYKGRLLPVTRWRTQTTVLPQPADEMISKDNHLVHQSITTGLGRLVSRIAEQPEAMAAVTGHAPEMMFTTFITPDRDMERWLHTRSARLRLRLKDGTMPTLPSVGVQRIEQDSDHPGETIVRIEVDRPQAASEVELAHEPYRTASSMINGEDAMIQALARRAVRSAGNDPMKRAEALRRAVYRHITNKGYDTAFASASETARTRRGDCSEHAVLLAAMLRSVDIPARVASGLVYVPDMNEGRGIFGWHMWTQALIDGKWIDLDSTLPGENTFHAGYVITSTSSLQDGRSETEMNSILLLIGNLEIDVLDYGYE